MDCVFLPNRVSSIIVSVARDAKEVAYDVEIFKVVLLVEISVMLCLPETTGAHVEP